MPAEFGTVRKVHPEVPIIFIPNVVDASIYLDSTNQTALYTTLNPPRALSANRLGVFQYSLKGA